MDTTTIGQRIRMLRKHYGLNQTAFGKAVGVSYGHISNIEAGKDKASDNLIRLIAIEYCANEDWIRSGVGDMLDQSFTQDHLSMNESIALTLEELSQILNSSPVGMRSLEVSILNSITSFFGENLIFTKSDAVSYLEIVDDLVHQLSRFDIALQMTYQRKTTKLDIKRLDELETDVFGEIANSLYELGNMYSDKSKKQNKNKNSD